MANALEDKPTEEINRIIAVNSIINCLYFIAYILFSAIDDMKLF